jgi:hypothetical protein
MKILKPFIITAIFASLCNMAYAQYREFTSQDGKKIVATPIKKSGDGNILVRAKDGKYINIKISLLSEGSQAFIEKWNPPNYERRITSKKINNDDSKNANDHLIVIKYDEKKNNMDSAYPKMLFQCGLYHQASAVKGLVHFADMVRDKESLIEKNALLRSNSTISLPNYTEAGKTIEWNLKIDNGKWELLASDTLKSNTLLETYSFTCNIPEEHIEYILD